MNWDQLQCSFCYRSLCGTLLAPLTLKQEVVGSNTTFFLQFVIVNSVEFLQNFIGKNPNDAQTI